MSQSKLITIEHESHWTILSAVIACGMLSYLTIVNRWAEAMFDQTSGADTFEK